MSQTEQIVLQTDTLTIGYRQEKQEKKLIENLNLKLQAGEMVCLLGPNGIGKSTLLRTLASLQPALAGKIWLNGKMLGELSRQEIASGISLVLTERPAAGNLKVYDLLSLGRHPHTGWSGRLRPADIEKIGWAIEITHISHLADQPVNSLSDGQVQKVMIARALAQDGELMILDEPTAHLDLPNKVEIMLLLQDLAVKTGKAILVASHELDLSLQTAHKLWIADCNQPLVVGIPEDLVLAGKLSGLFPSPHYQLDLESGKVKISHPGRQKILIGGNRNARMFWTRHALERNGFEVILEGTADLKVEVLEDNWKVGDRKVENLHDMLKILEGE